MLLGFALSGCVSLNLAPDYDPVMDQTVTKLHAETAAFFEKMLSATGNERAYSANKEFYARALGTVEAMGTRAENLEAELESKPLSENFSTLRAQYVDMRLLHQTNPPKGALASAKQSFDQLFRAILMHIRTLKTGTTDSTGS